MFKKFLGNGYDGFATRIGNVGQGQFNPMKTFDIVTRFTLVDLHARFLLNRLGDKLADQEHDDSQVDQLNAELLYGPLKAGDVGGRQVYDQETSEQPTPGYGYGHGVEEFATPKLFGVMPYSEERFEILGLGSAYSDFDLLQGGDENEHHG